MARAHRLDVGLVLASRGWARNSVWVCAGLRQSRTQQSTQSFLLLVVWRLCPVRRALSKFAALEQCMTRSPCTSRNWRGMAAAHPRPVQGNAIVPFSPHKHRSNSHAVGIHPGSICPFCLVEGEGSLAEGQRNGVVRCGRRFSAPPRGSCETFMKGVRGGASCGRWLRCVVDNCRLVDRAWAVRCVYSFSLLRFCARSGHVRYQV